MQSLLWASLESGGSLGWGPQCGQLSDLSSEMGRCCFLPQSPGAVSSTRVTVLPQLKSLIHSFHGVVGSESGGPVNSRGPLSQLSGELSHPTGQAPPHSRHLGCPPSALGGHQEPWSQRRSPRDPPR